MAAKKTRWSFLILEDNADLRETMRCNFADLFGEGLRVNFAASICEAIDKIKKRMREGDPYDAFWIDLYLDYFSYENEPGEILSVDSFSQIIAADAFLRHHHLEELEPHTIIRALEVDHDPFDKSSPSYSSLDKLRLLQKFSPFCQSAAQSTFETLLETSALYLQNEEAGRNEINLYARHALDFVFQLFLRWARNPKRRDFSPFEEEASASRTNRKVSILPERTDKSDQSWTIFHAWTQQFYNAVALNATGYEEYFSANSLLREIKKLRFEDYPQFLVNTAYQRRRQELLEASTVWPAPNVIVAQCEFKGDQKNRAFMEYLFRICRHLRRPYLSLKHKRRGYLLSESALQKAHAEIPRTELQAPLLSDDDLVVEFTTQAFYPELTANFGKLTGSAREWVAPLIVKAKNDLAHDARVRERAMVTLLSFCLPRGFLEPQVRGRTFELEFRLDAGKARRTTLTFDEGRWLFFELARSRWFPKCFYMHSNLMPQERGEEKKSYFLPASQLVTKAFHLAALERNPLFPNVSTLENKTITLPVTPAFYERQSDYIASFDWEAFFETTFAAFDASRSQPLAKPAVLQAQRLLLLLRHTLDVLHVRRLASKLMNTATLTPSTLCEMLDAPEYNLVEEVFKHTWRQIERAKDSPRLVAEQYLPGIKNAFAVVFCFYALPAPDLIELYNFWVNKRIHIEGTRPTEKFSAISRKLGNVQLTKSAHLPAQAEHKHKFLYLFPTLANASEGSSDFSDTNAHHFEGAPDFMRCSREEFLHLIRA